MSSGEAKEAKRTLPDWVERARRKWQYTGKDDRLLARSAGNLRVLETSGPPTVYVPPECVESGLLVPTDATSFCEWKGKARYWAPKRGGAAIAWGYPEPLPGFERLAGWFSFYPARVACFLGGATVRPQPGGFYGGWLTPEIVGPFKGEPGSEHW